MDPLDDESLEREEAERCVSAECPYCGEAVTLRLVPGDESQRHVEDCPVCCRPWDVHIQGRGEGLSVTLLRDDD